MIAKTQKVGGRVGVVGAGHRARLYTKAVSERDQSQIIAYCDLNVERIEHHQALLEQLGRPRAKAYHADDFIRMLEECELDTLVVTTVDATHDEYIIPALERGIRVLTEKPMTTTIDKCKSILSKVKETNGSLQVLFNYRYNPVHWKIEEVIASGAIGKVASVHFEWLLDTVHGADYFRRWHRYKDKSGGLMVHKSSHHFDLVNFWINAQPKTVFAMGQLSFYGQENGKRSGWGKDYYRARGSEVAKQDPFAIQLDKEPALKELYYDTEHVDNYHRDMNVFAPDITIEDDMAVLVRYNTGTTMSYHLTAYSPWEGYRVMFNGDQGRLELEVVESEYRKTDTPGGWVHGEAQLPQEGKTTIRLQKLWGKMEEVPFVKGEGGHGGGDDAMLDQLFGPRKANEIDGALAIAVGLAANESMATGQSVDIDKLFGQALHH